VNRLRRGSLVVATIPLTVLGVVTVGAPTALAAPSDGYAAWTFGGTTNNFNGTVGLPAGFPATTFTTNSRTPPSPPLPSGSTVWLPAGSPFGAVFGSSQDKRYLSLRPAADGVGSPSTTTYTFADPTPTSGWGIALGDIDAEALTVSARDSSGAPVAGADLGLEGSFNYCAPSPRSSSCPGQVTVVPTATVGATSIQIEDAACPPANCDTQGEAAWFRPTVPLSSLTVVSTWKAGLPAYQTWFAGLSNAVSGTVSGDCNVGTAEVDVLLVDGPGGRVLATTTTAADGTYSFDRVLGQSGYRVRIDPPPGVAVDGPTSQAVNTTAGNATGVDFATVGSSRVRGSVVADGDPIAAVAVTLLQGGTQVDKTTTDSDGGYVFAGVPNGDYRVLITPPATFEAAGPTEHSVSVRCGNEQIVDTLLQKVYVVEGEITNAEGDPIPDAEVTISEPDGPVIATTTTDENGHFEIPGITEGEYELTIDPPAPDATQTLLIKVPLGKGGLPPIVVAPAGGAPSAEALPDVGGVSPGVLGLGLVMTLLGAGIVVWSRRPAG
jgi:hypothetical protein